MRRHAAWLVAGGFALALAACGEDEDKGDPEPAWLISGTISYTGGQPGVLYVSAHNKSNPVCGIDVPPITPKAFPSATFPQPFELTATDGVAAGSWWVKSFFDVNGDRTGMCPQTDDLCGGFGQEIVLTEADFSATADFTLAVNCGP